MASQPGKELWMTTAVEELVRDEVLREALPRLPDYLQTRFTGLPRIEEEINQLKANLEELRDEEIPPWAARVYEHRIGELESIIKGLHKVAAVVRLGFEPYTPPAEWWCGFVEPDRFVDWALTPENTGDPDMNPLEYVFQAPIPPTPLREYLAAKRTGLFDQFLVVSPDRKHFRQISPSDADPVIVGYVSTSGPVHFGWKEEAPHLDVRKGTGFWITGWNLREDRETAGVN
jgi:hypothetical protein